MNKADLRTLVLEVIHECDSPEGFKSLIIKRAASDFNPMQDMSKASEVLWELLVQGILAPGRDEVDDWFSFFHLTEYGRQCLDAGTILPHDPDGYLKQLQQKIRQPLDDIVLIYITEGLQTFLGGHYLAATVMLGVASEQCIDLLIDAYSNAIADVKKKKKFERTLKQAGRSVKRRFDVLRADLLALSLPSELKDALDIQLSGIFTLIRYSRNDAGHPTGLIVDRDAAYANFLLFPQYCKRVYGLIGHFQTHQV